jgi:hypothetical protein
LAAGGAVLVSFPAAPADAAPRADSTRPDGAAPPPAPAPPVESETAVRADDSLPSRPAATPAAAAAAAGAPARYGLPDSAGHVTGCHLNQETRVHSAVDDVCS